MKPRAVTDGLVGLALSRQLQDREAEADQCLREAREFARWTGAPAYLDVVDSGQARIALLRGDQDAAARWLVAFHGEPDVPVKIFFLEYPEITACRVLVAKGTPGYLGQAATRLEPLEAESRRLHHDCQLAPLLVMKSLLYSKTKRVQDALAVLAQAVGLAWPGRWVLPFIEGGRPSRNCCDNCPRTLNGAALFPGSWPASIRIPTERSRSNRSRSPKTH